MTISHCVLGIDPGLSGAIAFYAPDAPATVTAEDMPIVAGEVDAVTLATRIRQMAPTMAIIELVGARPGQGVTSMFKFGRAFGTAIGVISALQIPIHYSSPLRWKKHFRLTTDKEQSRREAIRIFPASASQFSRKKDHGRAEAALMARYAADTILRRDAA